MILIRPYEPSDHPAIAETFTRAIHETASAHYTPEQCEAWSAHKPNPEHWRIRCEKQQPFVAMIGGRLAGFLELDPDGHIDCAYTHPDFQRQGVMSALVRHAIRVCEERGIARMYVEASIPAMPMFRKHGFVIVRENTVSIRSVELMNYIMEFHCRGGG